MEHTQAEERTRSNLQKSLQEIFQEEYPVDASTPHVLKVSRTDKPTRSVILNFSGADLFFHREESGQGGGAAQVIRLNQDGTPLELRSGAVISDKDIVSAIRSYLAA